MSKVKLGIVGCGFLGNIVVDAWHRGLLPEFEFVGCISRSAESARTLAEKAGCPACADLDALLATKPDYVIEAASPHRGQRRGSPRHRRHLLADKRDCRLECCCATPQSGLADRFLKP